MFVYSTSALDCKGMTEFDVDWNFQYFNGGRDLKRDFLGF
jgi:hypothetical protein